MMISLTTNAMAAVKAAMSRAADAPEGVRLVADADARNAVTYMLHLERSARAGDMVIEQCGLKLFIDGRSHAMADGLRIDFVSSPRAAGFVFEAPAHAPPAAAPYLLS